MVDVEVGVVTHFFNHLSVATVKFTAPVRVGDTLTIKGAHDDVTFRLESMQMNHTNVNEASAGQEVGIKLPQRAHEGSRVYVVRS